jgi:hypothetical protein
VEALIANLVILLLDVVHAFSVAHIAWALTLDRPRPKGNGWVGAHPTKSQAATSARTMFLKWLRRLAAWRKKLLVPFGKLLVPFGEISRRCQEPSRVRQVQLRRTQGTATGPLKDPLDAHSVGLS